MFDENQTMMWCPCDHMDLRCAIHQPLTEIDISSESFLDGAEERLWEWDQESELKLELSQFNFDDFSDAFRSDNERMWIELLEEHFGLCLSQDRLERMLRYECKPPNANIQTPSLEVDLWEDPIPGCESLVDAIISHSKRRRV
jgi:hypothetical protein